MIILVPFVLCAVQTASFAFQGGSPGELCNALSRRTEVQAFMMAEEPYVAPFEINWQRGESKEDDLAAFAESLARELRMNVEYRGELLISPRCLPWYRFPALAADRQVEVEFPEHKDQFSVKGNSVLCVPEPRKYFWPVYLPIHEFAKHTSAHRFLRESPVSFSPGVIDQGRFISNLAKCIGAKVVEKDQSVFLDVDVSEFRKQFAEHWERKRVAAGSEVERSKLAFASEAIKAASADILREMVEKENSAIDFEIQRGSRAHERAMDYTRVLLKAVADPDSGYSEGYRQHLRIVAEEGNFDRPLRVSLSTRGTVDVKVMIGNQNGGIVY